MKQIIIHFTLLSILLFSLISCGDNKPAANDKNFDAQSVYMLLDLMELLVEKNPGYQAVTASIDSLKSQDRSAAIDDIMNKNNDIPEINQKLTVLLDSPAYKLYYKQFKNVNHATHKMTLLALPYAWFPTPGGVSRTLYEICLNLDKMKPWVEEILSQIDFTKSHNLAIEWLPKGDYEIPPVHFIMDGNGDAFARDGEVCFDLFSVLLSHLPRERKFDMLNTVSVTNAENVLAHELFHIYASPFLKSKDAPINLDWKTTQKSQLVKQMVTEGIAMQCNPLTGFKKEIFEDSTVVTYWISQFNSMMQAIDNDKVTENEYKEWLSETYFIVPSSLLSEYFSKDYQDKELEQIVRDNMIDRPTLIYTMGWWMVSNILKTENGKEKVIGIISDYRTIFEEYNNSLPAASDDLKIIF